MVSRFPVLSVEEIAPNVKRLSVSAPLIASKASVGQFVILRVDDVGERFPLTLVDWDPDKGVIELIVQEVGISTKKLGRLKVNDYIADIVGPLGTPSEIGEYGEVVVIGGGVGTALIYPWVRYLKKAGNRVLTIVGARNKDLLLLESELAFFSDEFYISTDDGSKGFKGFTSDVLRNLLGNNRKFNLVMAAGPVPMMRVISEVTRPYKIKTIVSLNPIMVDGTGMCGGCRVTVGGRTLFACVDGPEFDGHQVDFNELIARLKMYKEEETIGTFEE